MGSIFAIAKNSWKEVYRKKDFYVFGILLLVFLIILLNETFYEVPDISRFLKDLGFSLLWLFSLIIAVTFSARQIPAELSTHTIQPLLAKPVSRWQMLLGKFLGSALASVFSFTVFYIIFAVITQLKGEGIGKILFFQTYLFGLLFLCLICAVAIFFSTFLTISANITIAVFIYLFMTGFGEYVRVQILSPHTLYAFFSNLLYQLLPHFEFYDLRMRIVHAWEPLPTWVVSAVFLYTLIYVCFLLLLSYLKIRKRVL